MEKLLACTVTVPLPIATLPVGGGHRRGSLPSSSGNKLAFARLWVSSSFPGCANTWAQATCMRGGGIDGESRTRFCSPMRRVGESSPRCCTPMRRGGARLSSPWKATSTTRHTAMNNGGKTRRLTRDDDLGCVGGTCFGASAMPLGIVRCVLFCSCHRWGVDGGVALSRCCCVRGQVCMWVLVTLPATQEPMKRRIHTRREQQGGPRSTRLLADNTISVSWTSYCIVMGPREPVRPTMYCTCTPPNSS